MATTQSKIKRARAKSKAATTQMRVAKARTRTQHPKQGMLMEVRHPYQREIINLATDYRAAVRTRMQAQQPEIELGEKLLKKMQEHKITSFNCEGVKVKLVPTKLKVKVKIDDGRNDDNDGD